mgnify:FL=1
MKKKWCPKCKTKKATKEFYKRSLPRKGFSAYCKKCQNNASSKHQKTYPAGLRKAKLKYRYNLSIKEYEILLEKQNGVCAICKKGPTEINLAVDHIHFTKQIRGLLCYRCNLAIALLQEDVEIISNAIIYLENYDAD